ncbi:MAG: sugar phosphate isomerase/epimerase [Armatimonadetes bacterium]|nr:sugar phosphate isomerase/epimerase [Armatimonadota bacterium]
MGSSAHAIAPIKRPDSGPGRLRLSCAAYSFRYQLQGQDSAHPMTMLEFISNCAKWGCDAVELTSYYFDDPPTDAYVLSLKKAAFLHGLDVSGMPIGTNYCSADPAERAAQIAHTKKWIDRAALLGAPCIRVFAGGDAKGNIEEQRKWCVDALNECLEAAGKVGIYLAMENHGGIVAGPDELLTLVKMVDSEWFGVNLDTGNFHTDDPYRDVARVAPYAVVAQVKTEVVQGGKRQDADLGRMMKILRDSGYHGYVALEYEAAAPALEAVPKHLADLRRLIQD